LFAAQEVPAAEQTQVLVVESQMFEQQSLLLVHESLVGIQATQVDVVVSQTSEQQSLLLAQPESPVGIQATQVLVVESQMWEQQSKSLAQEPALAIQQVPLLQVWAAEHVETQVPLVESHFRHWLVAHGADRHLEPQTFALSQHPLLRQV
jgi:hypothetical protein